MAREKGFPRASRMTDSERQNVHKRIQLQKKEQSAAQDTKKDLQIVERRFFFLPKERRADTRAVKNTRSDWCTPCGEP